VRELGLVGYKNQFLLQAQRPLVHFGHARWREAEQEAADGAAWLAAAEGRALMTSSRARQACFAEAPAVDLGFAHGERWYLIAGSAEPACVRRGDRSRARLYVPPNASLDTES
jgi:hypothetical protein